jgi:tetratricopeptide (TPR) repeat protein
MDLTYINEISKVFIGFENNPLSIYNVVNSVSKDDLTNTLRYYEERQRHYKINKVIASRVLIINKLLKGIVLNEEIVDEIKNKIQKEAIKNNYKKNIFHSWNPNWRILFPIYYFKNRQSVINILKTLSERLINDLGLNDYAKQTVTDFNGSQHFGNTGCWFAIYNNTHSTQKTALQLFFLLRDGIITFGLFDYKTRNDIGLDKCLVSEITYERILEKYRQYVEIIKNDKKVGHLAQRVHRDRVGIQKININGYLRKPIESTFVRKKHNEIQEILLKSLQCIFGDTKVLLEKDFIDIKVETEREIILYEIKTYDKAIFCIRDAIGQLLLYSSRLKKVQNKKIKLVVVGLGVDNLDSNEFKKYLLDNFNFDFEYKYFVFE